MKRALTLVAVAAVLGFAAWKADARPPAPFSLDLMLNGEPQRPLQADGGGLLLFTADAGLASTTVVGGGVYLVVTVGTACNVCTFGPTNTLGTSLDGGCSNVVQAPNYGEPIASGASRKFVLQDATTTLVAVPTTGASCVAPVFRLR